jgi:6-pyruvoyltetrahydropterin/6-carboxytetrahydropterin synthase
MYRVSEAVRFCYGHRLMNYQGKCARLHGHNGRVEIVLAAATLDPSGFVMDFGDITRRAEAFLERFDHRMLLRDDDPLVPVLRAAGEDLVTLPVNPTAEHLARLVHEHLTEAGFPVAEVRFWETETSLATYSAS